MLCLIKVNSYIIELTVHTSSKCVLVLLCVKLRLQKVHLIFISSYWTLKHCDKTNANIIQNCTYGPCTRTYLKSFSKLYFLLSWACRLKRCVIVHKQKPRESSSRLNKIFDLVKILQNIS